MYGLFHRKYHKKYMITRGTPISGNAHMKCCNESKLKQNLSGRFGDLLGRRRIFCCISPPRDPFPEHFPSIQPEEDSKTPPEVLKHHISPTFKLSYPTWEILSNSSRSPSARGSAPANSSPSWLRPAGTATAPNSPRPAPAVRHPSDRCRGRRPSPAGRSCAEVLGSHIQWGPRWERKTPWGIGRSKWEIFRSFKGF